MYNNIEKNLNSRTELIFGKETMKYLEEKHVAVFGIGGVGSFTVEALARCNIGKISLIDGDNISKSNINRQIHAMESTLGEVKVEAMKNRILDINSKIKVYSHKEIYKETTQNKLLKDNYDYVIDAIDTIDSKIDLIQRCKERNIPIVSSMGAGNKIDPSKIKIDDIYNTSICPLARKIRKELRKKDINSLQVVYSTEKPVKIKQNNDINKKQIPGSVPFVPSVAGLFLASIVIRNLTKKEVF